MPINSFLYPGPTNSNPYVVDNSCRFNRADSAYMHKTPGGAGSTKIFTFSAWVKRGNLGASYSTNEAVTHASGYWIRLLDGDDNVTYKSTSKMLYLAHRYKVKFVYGLI